MRTPEDVAAMLDDLLGVAFKLRDVIMLVETQLSGKDGETPETGDLRVQEAGVTASVPSPVPANPAGGADVTSHPSTTTSSGGDLISGTELAECQYGDPVQEGTTLRYYAGPCRSCGRPVRMIGKPRPGGNRLYRCWACIKGAKR